MREGSRCEFGAGKVILDHPAPHVARVTISNPARRNALNHDILDGLVEAVGAATARCLIIRGTDEFFSAGYDLAGIPDDDFVEHTDRLIAHPETAAIDAIEDYPFPTIAALSGAAIGGGLELAIACDFRIATVSAVLGMPPARLGLVYSHTGLRRFIDTVGVPRTRELFLLGRQIDAATAFAWGMITRLAPEPDLERAALELAYDLVSNSPVSVQGNKRIIASLIKARSALTDESIGELIALRRASLQSPDIREGVRAFEEKRRPRWPNV